MLKQLHSTLMATWLYLPAALKTSLSVILRHKGEKNMHVGLNDTDVTIPASLSSWNNILFTGKNI